MQPVCAVKLRLGHPSMPTSVAHISACGRVAAQLVFGHAGVHLAPQAGLQSQAGVVCEAAAQRGRHIILALQICKGEQGVAWGCLTEGGGRPEHIGAVLHKAQMSSMWLQSVHTMGGTPAAPEGHPISMQSNICKALSFLGGWSPGRRLHAWRACRELRADAVMPKQQAERHLRLNGWLPVATAR